MRITNDLIDAASKAYAEKRHPGRWDGEPWGIAGRENHRRAIKAALRSAFGVIKKPKPKITLTKKLPIDEGEYYFKGRPDYNVSIVSVRANHLTGLMHVYEGAEERQPVDVYGGYWAKVEQDHFEFEK